MSTSPTVGGAQGTRPADNTITTGALWAVVDRELVARDLGRNDLWELCAARHGGKASSYARRAWRWEHEAAGIVPLDRADEILIVLGLHLVDLDVDDQAPPEPRCRGGGHPAGIYGYLTDTQLRALHVAYQQGMSLRAIAQQIHPRTRYASVKSCAAGIHQGFIRLGLERRERVAAVQAARTTHGLARRGAVDRDHRLAMRRARGEIKDRPMCAGTKTTYPGRGRPCRARAMTGSDYCPVHTPERRDQVVRDLAHARTRQAVTA